jgi:DNA-binding MarR family transcriptional regulator
MPGMNMSADLTAMVSSPGEVTPARLQVLPSRLLNYAAAYGDRLVTDRLADVAARKWHYAVLASLQESGPASQALLSRRAGLYHSDLVGVINELADGGYVERAPDTADRRRNVITITGQGRRQLRRLDKIIASAQEELLAPLTENERQQLSRLLTRLVEHHTGMANVHAPAAAKSRRATPSRPGPTT